MSKGLKRVKIKDLKQCQEASTDITIELGADKLGNIYKNKMKTERKTQITFYIMRVSGNTQNSALTKYLYANLYTILSNLYMLNICLSIILVINI